VRKFLQDSRRKEEDALGFLDEHKYFYLEALGYMSEEALLFQEFRECGAHAGDWRRSGFHRKQR
jgi:hypothetical protein|tara:strand:- start:443 stop:634 length:192 start_codon:yes stop_codon:yes gene_type:complete